MEIMKTVVPSVPYLVSWTRCKLLFKEDGELKKPSIILK